MTRALSVALATLALGLADRAPAASDQVLARLKEQPARSRVLATRTTSRAPAVPGHAAVGYDQRVRLLPDGRTEITVAVLASRSRRPGPTRPEPGSWRESGIGLDEDVARVAGEIVPEDAPPQEVSERVLAWVSLNVAHADLPAHDESPASTLATRVASCVGRSRLAVALLVARGVPARTVHGLLLPGGTRPGDTLDATRFELHRWVESWIPGQGWVPSDPGRSIHVVDAAYVFLQLDLDAYDPEAQRDLVLRIGEAPHALALETSPAPREGHPLIFRHLLSGPHVEAPPARTP